jgi:hypothetical protein
VSLSNQFWRLWDVDINTVAWEQLPSAPTARAGHSLVYDVSVHRLVTMGGDTGGATSDNSLWGIFVEEMVWTDETPATGSPSTSGHIAFFTPGRVFARKPERLTPGPGSSGTWEPPIAAPLIQEWYPFHFTIANGPHAGKIFNAGPSAPTYLLDLSAPGWTAWPATSGFKGGSAVIYGPDRVMKCGSRDTEGGLPPPPGIGTTKFIVLDQAGASWASSSPMDSGRVNHNLTLLPSGEVLVTGGTELVTDAAIGGRARGLVELWRPPDATYPNGVWYGGHETTTRPRCCSRMDGS